MTALTTKTPGYLAPSADPIGTQLRAAGGVRHLHAVGCRIDGGGYRHGVRGFHCNRCAATIEGRIEGLLTRLDRAAFGR